MRGAAEGSGVDDVFRAKMDGVTIFSADATQLSLYSDYYYTPISLDISAFADNAVHTLLFEAQTSDQVVDFDLDEVYLLRCAEEGGSSNIYLPLVPLDPSPTPIPMAYFNVTNNTGGQLCVDVKNSGIGPQCTSGSTLVYGPFPAGTYDYSVSSSRCGSKTYNRYFAPGNNTESFKCTSASSGTGALGK